MSVLGCKIFFTHTFLYRILILFLRSGEACAISVKHSVSSDDPKLQIAALIIIPLTVLLGALQHGSCTIQPTRIDFSSEELVDMIRRCQLNRLNQFATFLGSHIRHCRNNPKLLAFVQSLDEVLYSGLPLPREEEDYAYTAGIRLVVCSQSCCCHDLFFLIASP